MSINNPYTPPSSDTQIVKPQTQGPKGLGGWLILAAIIIIINLLAKVFQSIDYTNTITTARSLFLNTSLYRFILFTCITSILLTFCWAIVCFLFFTKRKAFKIVLKITLTLQVTVLLTSRAVIYSKYPKLLELSGSEFEDLAYMVGYMIGTFLVLIIWFLYINKSKRVANTFIY